MPPPHAPSGHEYWVPEIVTDEPQGICAHCLSCPRLAAM